MEFAKLHLDREQVARTGTTRSGASDIPEFMLMCDLFYGHHGECSSSYSIVPAGYVTDLFSLPTQRTRKMWQPKHPENAGPSVIHDWEYDLAVVPRSEADHHFRIAMKDMEYELHQRWGGWLAVRAGGWKGYGKPTAINQALINTFRNRTADESTEGAIFWLFHTQAERYAAAVTRLNELRQANGLEPWVPPTTSEEGK